MKPIMSLVPASDVSRMPLTSSGDASALELKSGSKKAFLRRHVSFNEHVEIREIPYSSSKPSWALICALVLFLSPMFICLLWFARFVSPRNALV